MKVKKKEKMLSHTHAEIVYIWVNSPLNVVK
jgi:hypothetical protein